MINTKIIVDIHKYQVLYKIGAGANSVVYKVREKKTEDILAAKLYRDEIDIDHPRLFREIEIISKLLFPSILKYYGYSLRDFNDEKHIVILSEFLENGSLEEIIEHEKMQKAPIEWNFTKKLINIYGIASAMEYLHSQSIIHRDLKPTNILEDEHFYPKVCDFGSSKFRPADSNYLVHSIENISPFFIAPEILDDNIYNYKCDVFSFAMTIYNMLTCNQPDFGSKNSFNYISGILKGKRPIIDSKVPLAYKSLIESCWVNNPDDRPDFNQIVEDLKNNREYITDEVDEKEFNEYIEYIESNGEKIFIKEEPKRTQIPQMPKKQQMLKKPENKLHPLSLNVKNSNLQKFAKQEKLGSGFSADVFKIVEVETKKIFAAKIMKDLISEENKNSIKAIHLSREVTILSQLSHPSIVKFYGYSSTDFINLCRPVILTEYIKNRSLEDILEIERNGFKISFWNDTMKLINIYGIAASMSYLHSKNIIHRDLKPGNILVDDYLFPNLADFGFSKLLASKSSHTDDLSSQIQSDLMGTDGFIAPEIWEDNIYTKSGDVYAFGMLVYEIVTKQFPFHGKNNCQIMYCVLYKKERPKLNDDVAEHYRKLIEKCWSQDPNERPTFEMIVDQLEKDSKFITKSVNKKVYFNYIQFIKQSLKSTKTSSIMKSFQKYSIEPIFKEFNQNKSFLLSEGFVNIDEYVKQSEIYQNSISSFYQVSNKNTGKVCMAEISRFDNGYLTPIEKEKLSFEVKIISQLNHPSIQRVIGFSMVNFKHHHKSVIIREFSKNQTLFDILKKERENKGKKSNFSFTKKLINIFGIASGMSYLHSNNILHRELRTKNIFLDDDLKPKITEFGFFIKPANSKKMKSESHRNDEDIPYYLSPEILQSNDQTKESDVYSFAFVVFEILTSEVPFQNVKSYNQFFNEVVKKCSRPSLGDKIPIIYANLISSCWEQNPKLRPSFTSIVNELKNNQQYLTDKINKKEFHDYVKFIEKK